MAWEHQPRWPRKTPIAPSHRGPGGGRWRDDGKPNKPGHTWAEVASSVIGHVLGRHHGESAHGLADDVRHALRGGHREHGTGHPVLSHDRQMQLDYPAQMQLRGAGDLTHGGEHAPYHGNDPQQLAIRERHGLPADASAHETGEAIRYHSTGGRAGSPGRSTHTLAQHGHVQQPTPEGQHIAAALHEDWRSSRKREDGSYEPRMKTTTDQEWIAAHGSDQVDIANTSYHDLPADWQKENSDAGEVVARILRRHGGRVNLSDAVTRQAVGHEIHTEWLGRENNSYARGGPLDVPFSQLPADEQEKDIAQVRVGMAAGLHAAETRSGSTWADRVSEGIEAGSGKITRQQAFGPEFTDASRARGQQGRMHAQVYELMSDSATRLMTPTQRDNYDQETLSHLGLADLKSARDAIALKGSRRSTAGMLDSMMVDRLDAEIARRGGGDTEGMNQARHGVDALVGHVRSTRSSGKKIGDRALEHLDQAGHTLVQLHDMRRVLERRGEDHRDSALTPHLYRAITEAIRRQNGSGGS